MKLKPAIALYIGESYASIGLFDTSQKILFQKSIFLPQVSLKNLLNQTKIQIQEHFPEYSEALPIFVVTKYFDRLKQFRLGGSISQVIKDGFQNSYTLEDSRKLSLAAPQLIISLKKNSISEELLQQELERIKKINPELNKIVISIAEDDFSKDELNTINAFFANKELKIFNCMTPHDQAAVRKVLLNAGSEGTKEEIITDIKENLHENSVISFFCKGQFQDKFENANLFMSASSFLIHYLKKNGFKSGTFLDFEAFIHLQDKIEKFWDSPWGRIQTEHHSFSYSAIHPFNEVKLDHLSLIHIETKNQLLEPGPVIAGRAVKPLVVDLFHTELSSNSLITSLLPQIQQDNLKSKLNNLFTVLEKSQKSPNLTVKLIELQEVIKKTIVTESEFYKLNENHLIFGPLSSTFTHDVETSDFSWPTAIMSMAEGISTK